MGNDTGNKSVYAPPSYPEGRKDDQDKLRYDLLPVEAIEDLVKVLTFGAKKYAPDNWKKVSDANNRYYAAALRHLQAWRAGERIDSESGLPHLAHAMCCLTFLSWLNHPKILNMQNLTVFHR